MLIVCPSCASEYMIDPGRLGAEGRTVRCASCKSTWFVTPEAEETSASEAPPDLAANDAGDEWAAAAAEPVRPVRDDAAEREPDAWIRAMASGGAKQRPAMAPRLRAVARSLAIIAVLVAVAAAVWGRP